MKQEIINVYKIYLKNNCIFLFIFPLIMVVLINTEFFFWFLNDMKIKTMIIRYFKII